MVAQSASGPIKACTCAGELHIIVGCGMRVADVTRHGAWYPYNGTRQPELGKLGVECKQRNDKQRRCVWPLTPPDKGGIRSVGA